MIWYYVVIIAYLLVMLYVAIILTDILFGSLIDKFWVKFKTWIYFKFLDL